MTTPRPLAYIFAVALTAAVVTLLVLGGEWLLQPVAWKVGALWVGGVGVLWALPRKRKS